LIVQRETGTLLSRDQQRGDPTRVSPSHEIVMRCVEVLARHRDPKSLWVMVGWSWSGTSSSASPRSSTRRSVTRSSTRRPRAGSPATPGTRCYRSTTRSRCCATGSLASFGPTGAPVSASTAIRSTPGSRSAPGMTSGRAPTGTSTASTLGRVPRTLGRVGATP
jgi:hypothetical protein